MPTPAVADVVSIELLSMPCPHYRRIRPVPATPVRYLGGEGAEIVLTLRGEAGAEALVMTHGAEVP